MNTHAHKQAVGNTSLDGQSLLGVVLPWFPLIPEGAPAELWLCKPVVCPRLTVSLTTMGFIPKGLPLSSGTNVPRVNEPSSEGENCSADSRCHLRDPKYVEEGVVHIKEIQG